MNVRHLALALVLVATMTPAAHAGLSVDARPFVGYVGVVEAGETFHASRDVAEELGLDICGGDAISAWRVRVTAIGLAPLEQLVVRGYGFGDAVVLTYDAPMGEVRSMSGTTCMAGAALDGTGLLKPVGFTVQEVEEL